MQSIAIMWILLVILISKATFASDAFYVKPTYPLNIDCPGEAYCYTLNEWIESGSGPFTNDTTVTLLAGEHLINSKKDSLLTENVHSLNFTGDHERERVMLLCTNGFSFSFKFCKSVRVSRITLDSCTLVFSYIIKNITIINTVLIGGRLKIHHYLPDQHDYSSVFRINRDHCVVQANVYFSDSIFQNSSISLEVKKIFGDASCIHLDIRDVKIRDKSEGNALTIHNTYSITIVNVSFLNNTSPVCIQSAHKATLANIKVWYNFSPMLSLRKMNELIFKGILSFKWNSGHGNGIVITSVEKITMDETFKSSEVEFCNNHIEDDLLSITATKLVWITFATVNFVNNTSEDGGIMTLDEVYLQSSYSSIVFENNTSLRSKISGAIMLLEQTRAEFNFDSKVTFYGNSAQLSGGVTLMSSSMSFEDSVMRFEHNVGGNRGAMAFYERSFVMTSGAPGHNRTVLTFHSNQARGRGGALFIKDSDYINSLTHIQYDHFIRRPTIQTSLTEPNHSRHAIKFDLSHNSAKISGSDIYGGWIDSYFISYWGIFSSELYNGGDHHNAIASDPTRICMCVDSVPVCRITEHQTEVFPGQTFEIEAVAVGQRMGIVPSIVIVEVSDKEGRLGEGQDVQSVNRQCSLLHFKVFSEARIVTLDMKAQSDVAPQRDYIMDWLPPMHHTVFSQFMINATLKKCPLGFVYGKELQRCLCLRSIDLHDGTNCDYETFSITRTKYNWLLATFEYNNTQHHGVIVHDHCPYDYCRTDPDSLTFHLEFPDAQCAFNRSGILCGACQRNFSQVLGMSRCKTCSDVMLLALIPGVSFAGILLVGFLMFLNLTVSEGTINGLIFYANIIRTSQPVFFPPEINISFLSTFIAWLNLDLGIETCFYNGLDAYARTWLQFVFPLYIWLMVITIIVASHYSITVSRLTPNNALQVLATLFLLSYVKILRAVITVFSSTVLLYPDGFIKRVWLYDGNIEFLTGKHIPLFIATLLLLILLSFPYTLSLVSIQWLQRISHYRPLFWVHRLMPLFDAYTGPYKHKHRYWTAWTVAPGSSDDSSHFHP